MANIDRIEVNCITMAICILWVLVLYKSNRGDINVVNYCYDGYIPGPCHRLCTLLMARLSIERGTRLYSADLPNEYFGGQVITMNE